MKRSSGWAAVAVLACSMELVGCANGFRRVSTLWPSAKRNETAFSVARLKERDGNLPSAKQVYEELHHRNPKDVRVTHRLAVVSMRLGEHEQAIKYFEQAQSADPHNSELAADYGYARYLQDDLPGAEELFKQALASDPNNKRALNNMALVVGLQGRGGESFALFRSAVDEAEAHANLAYVYVQRGEGQKATEEYSKAVSLNPAMKSAGEALAQIAEMKSKCEAVAKSRRDEHSAHSPTVAEQNTEKPKQAPARSLEVAESVVAAVAESSPNDTNPIVSAVDKSEPVATQSNHELASASKAVSAAPSATEAPAPPRRIERGIPAPKKAQPAPVASAEPVKSAIKESQPQPAKPNPIPECKAAECASVDPHATALCAALRGDDANGVQQALQELGRMGGKAGSAADSIRALSEHPDPMIRLQAAETLWRITGNCEACLPAAVSALTQKDEGVRSVALAVLGEVGPQAAGALNAALQGQDGYVRLNVAEALSKSPAWKEHSASMVVDCLQDGDRNVRWLATYSLGEMASSGEQAVPSLVAVLRDEDTRVRAGAAFALGEIGPKAGAAVAELQNATKDPDPEVRASAESALCRIQTPRAAAK